MPSQKPSRKKSTSLASSTSRPPIVAVLGHVDHGKTSLLSKIKEIDLTRKEHGGITQHIGAYQVNYRDKLITFIDTPGHATFSQMRSRGAKVADLVVLVVAVDEGFKPQTRESLQHIQAAKVPYLVALNKIDLPSVDIKRTKENLAKNGILLEGHGGEVVAVPVSAKTGQGLKDLLEMILLLAEMTDIKGDPQGKLEAVVIESKLDRARGTLATILVRSGSLNVGDEIRVEEVGAKIKAMMDEKGKRVKTAGPSKPVEILGFSEAPLIGGKVEKGEPLMKVEKLRKSKAKISAEAEEKELKIILKTDVAGTLEAVTASLPENVAIIAAGVGDVTESEILLASATGATVIGFGVKIPGGVKKLAQTEGVAVETYQIIYELLEAIEERALKAMAPMIDEEVLGRAEIIAEFGYQKQRVAGCRIYEGQFNKKDKLHLQRGEKVMGDCQVKSMKQAKENVSRAEKGEELGLILIPSLDFKIGDVLVSYRKAGK